MKTKTCIECGGKTKAPERVCDRCQAEYNDLMDQEAYLDSMQEDFVGVA